MAKDVVDVAKTAEAGATELLERLTAKDVRALGRAISAVERGGPLGRALERCVVTREPPPFVVGLTGPPGVGKSSLADRLVTAFRARERRVAVLAIDPSSPVTGGAVLGDRVRMQRHADDPHVYVRSMASRGEAGGLARAAAGTVAVLGAAGFDLVLVETVGVGQGEIDITHLADVTLVIAVPGTGDDVQALKSGLMEIADVLVVNKCDREGADALAAVLEASVSWAERPGDAWHPPVVRVSAVTGAGIDELVETVERCRHDERFAAARSARRADMRALGTQRGVLDHVGIAVADGDAVRALLSDLFGLESDDRELVPGQGARVWFLGEGDARLELVAPAGDSSPLAKFLEKRGNGLHHVALRVPDLDAALAVLRQKGARLIDAEPRLGAHGRRVAFVHPAAAAGILFELVEGPAR